jgi:superfamily I DNA/RNA helicase
MLRDEWTDLTLSVTFRCPKVVVARQQAFVPDFKWGPDNKVGHFDKLTTWFPAGGADAAILCRNNAPLIRLAFQLLREQVPVNFLGKDIGANLKRLYNKLSDNGMKPIKATIDAALLYGQENPDKLDKADSLVAILESHDSVDSAMRFLTEARTNSITLATGHKAKGLEWERVYHLNPFLIPSKYVQEAKPDYEPEPGESPSDEWLRYQAQLQQENNLRYVIETRTKNELYLVADRGLQ